MRASWLICVALALTACGDPAGTTFEIELPPSTTTVELFMGVAHCTLSNDRDCMRLTPPGFSRPVFGEGFFLDSDLVQTVDEVADGKVVIRLAAAQDTLIKRLVVVGLDADGSISGIFHARDLMISSRDAEAWRVALEPAHALVEDAPGEDGHQVKIWRRKTDGQSACVMVRTVAAAADPEVSFLVPENDPDCDDAPTECDPLWHLAPATTVGLMSAASCFTNTAGGYCVLAGPPCDEQVPGFAGCEPTARKYCAPDTLCKNGCADRNFNNDAGATSCATTNATSTHQRCSMPTSTAGMSCGGSDVAKFDGKDFLEAAGAPDTTCLDVRIRDLSSADPTRPIRFERSAFLNFDLSPAPTVEVEVNLEGGTACGIEVRWKSGMSPTLAGRGVALIDLEVAAGHVIVPLELVFADPNGNCSVLPVCEPPFVASTALGDCLATP